jgi:hypothetical protein
MLLYVGRHTRKPGATNEECWTHQGHLQREGAEAMLLQGMSQVFWDAPGTLTSFVDSENKRIPKSAVVEKFQTKAGKVRLRIIAPAVRHAVREHFECSTLEGADLEDGFGQGSAGCHWDQRVFDGELMDSVASSSSSSGSHVLTNVTLGFLQDTGWCACWLLLHA